MDLQQFRYYTRWHEHVNELRYDAPADPWKTVRVDPANVTYYMGELALNWGLGRVAGGDWDSEENCGRLRETAIYRGLVQRFEEGRDWEETALYRQASEQFERGGTVRGYESLDAYRNIRCEYLDDLFESVAEEGYRPNEEAAHETADSDNAFEDAYANHLEPLVVVARDGDVYWTEGYHRFTIASILGIDEIPVYVLCRHEQWQRVRDRVHDESTLPPELDEHHAHPDLRDVNSP